MLDIEDKKTGDREKTFVRWRQTREKLKGVFNGEESEDSGKRMWGTQASITEMDSRERREDRFITQTVPPSPEQSLDFFSTLGRVRAPFPFVINCHLKHTN